MVRDRLERVLARFSSSPDWWGGVTGAAAPDLADASVLADLLEDQEDPDTADFLRTSRMPRVRPILVVLAARASGGAEVDAELQYAAELLHAALQLHDLALGPPGNRRRALARRVLRGVGWVGSNEVLVRAMELARHAPTPEVLGELVDTLRAFHEGQAVAGELLDGAFPTHAHWREHADGHTGALFAFCCRAGAHVGMASAGELAALGRFGRHLGRMWHLAEDVVLLQADDAAEHLVGRCLVGRPMLPLVIAAERAPEVPELWRAVIGEHDEDAAGRLLHAVRVTQAARGTREAMVQELWQARQALARFEVTPYRRALERLASGLARGPYEDMPQGPAYER